MNALLPSSCACDGMNPPQCSIHYSMKPWHTPFRLKKLKGRHLTLFIALAINTNSGIHKMWLCSSPHKQQWLQKEPAVEPYNLYNVTEHRITLIIALSWCLSKSLRPITEYIIIWNGISIQVPSYSRSISALVLLLWMMDEQLLSFRWLLSLSLAYIFWHVERMRIIISNSTFYPYRQESNIQ